MPAYCPCVNIGMSLNDVVCKVNPEYGEVQWHWDDYDEEAFFRQGSGRRRIGSRVNPGTRVDDESGGFGCARIDGLKDDPIACGHLDIAI